MLIHTALLTASLAASASPQARIVVQLNDPAASTPVTAAIEQTLQRDNFEVVAADMSKGLREVVAPDEVRLPEQQVSVLEADAKLDGDISYGEPQKMEGVFSVAVSMTIRLTDLGTGQVVATLRSTGIGIAASPLQAEGKASEQAVKTLFYKRGLKDKLGLVGQAAGQVVLVVRGIPNRDNLVELQSDLEQALAGAPVKELYYTRGLGKLILGGSASPKAMVGPDIATLISQKRDLALRVDEVANTRIVATYDRGRTVEVHALVLEPVLPRHGRSKAAELGKYVATQMATYDFARASYWPGRLSRDEALKRAQELGADVVIESELLGSGKAAVLALRVINAHTGRPIHRQQQTLEDKGNFGAAKQLLSSLQKELPEKITDIHEQRVLKQQEPAVNTAQRE